jgi:hypothetical protein
VPLLVTARRIMRVNLEKIRDGKHPPRIIVGTLTQAQLNAINAQKLEESLPIIVEEILFIGRHIYESRVMEDLYTIEDVLDQIYSGMEPDSTVVKEGWMTGMKNPKKRLDRYGNQVNDVVVFQCYSYHPNPELYGVIPKGDTNKPKAGKAT